MSGAAHILRPQGHYIGQVRERGCRYWETVTGRRKTAVSALAGAVLAMTGRRIRARVLFEDASGYFGPQVTMEASRR